MTTLNPSWIARLFAGAELSQLNEALEQCESELAATEARRAALDLEHQQLKANALGILSAIDTGYAYIEFDPQGLVLKANDRFCSLLGYTLDEILGRHHRVFVEPSYAVTQAYRDFWAALNTGPDPDRCVQADGEGWARGLDSGHLCAGERRRRTCGQGGQDLPPT